MAGLHAEAGAVPRVFRPESVAEAVRALPLAGPGSGFGVSAELVSSRGFASLRKLLEHFGTRVRRLTPAEASAVGHMLAAAPMPSGYRWGRHHDMLQRGPAVDAWREAGPEWVRKSLDVEPRRDPLEAADLEANEVRAEFARGMAAEREALPAEARGGPMREGFGPMVDYLAWARAAQARGYAITTPIGRGTSARALWQRHVFESKQRPSPELVRFLGEEGYQIPETFRLSDVLSEAGQRQLWRAHEVHAGVLTPEAQAKLLETARKLRGVRWVPPASEVPEMTPGEAAAILAAWNKGDWGSLASLGVHRATVAMTQVARGHGGGEPPELLEAYRSLPGIKVYEALEAFRGAATERDLDTARSILREIPESWLRTGELLAEPGKDIREGLDQADLSFGDFVREITAAETTLERAMFRIANAESEGFGGRLDADAIAKVAELSARVTEAMVTRGWVEISRSGSLEPTAKVLRLATELEHVRWVDEGYAGGKPEARDFRQPYEGDNSPWTKVCSDCATYHSGVKERVDEMADTAARRGEQTWSEKLRLVGARLATLLKGDRTLAPNWAAHLGAQLTREEFVQISSGIKERVAYTNRNRFGDRLAELAGKHYDETEALWSRAMPDLTKVERLYKEARGFEEFDPRKMELEPSQGGYSAAEKEAHRELALVARKLDGQAVDLPTARAREAYEAHLRLFKGFREVIVEHLFRGLRREIEDAKREGRQLPPNIFRRWRHTIGDDAAARDPAVAEQRLRATIEPAPGAVTTVEGMAVKAWGIRDYYAHVWPKTPSQGDGLHWVQHPGHKPGADDVVVGRIGEPHAGEPMERWRVEHAMNIAREHGFIRRVRHVRNLMPRFVGKDGWIEDPRYVARVYTGQVIRKVMHEKLVDDIDPHLFGTYRGLDEAIETREQLAEVLRKVPPDEDGHRFGVLGSVDEYFGLRLTGDLYRAKRYHLDGESWSPSKGRISKQALKEQHTKWRASTWRVSKRLTRLPEDPTRWQVGLSNGSDAIVIRGRDALLKAGLQYRAGGLVNYETGTAYNAVKDHVREVAGYDMDTGGWADWAKKSPVAQIFERAAAAVNELFYQATLGGSVLNIPAGTVQMLEGTLQNAAAIGGKAIAETFPDMRGATSYYMRVAHAVDPASAEPAARAALKGTPFVEHVLPVLEAGRWRPAHLLRTEHEAELSAHGWKRGFQKARRMSYGWFTTADLLTKSHAYYTAYKKALEQGEWIDPANGRRLRIVPDYVPLGETHRQAEYTVSAHEIARMVVEHTHFTQPRFAQPGLVKIPGWGLVGHLGTYAANITFEFGKGLFVDLPKYAATGDPAHAWMAQKSARYLTGLMLAYAVAGFFGRDVGEYVGTHPKDFGLGSFTLGSMVPAVKALPPWVRMYGYQLPRRASLPVEFWFGAEGVGVPATIGDMAMRLATDPTRPLAAVQDSAAQFWHTWGRQAFLGPGTRSTRKYMNYLGGGLQYTGAYPERPWEVRDLPLFGPVSAPRHRSTMELVADILLPGSSRADSEAFHHAEWAYEYYGRTGQLAAELRRKMRSKDPAEVLAAEQRLLEMGYQPRGYAFERQRIADDLPAHFKKFMRLPSTRAKLEMAIDTLADEPRAIREKAWKVIFGPTRQLGEYSAHALENLPRDLQRRGLEVLARGTP